MRARERAGLNASQLGSNRRRRHRWVYIAALTLVLGLFVGACGGDDDDTSSGGGDSSAASSDEPIKIGNISSITNLGGTFEPYQQAVEAYFNYINEEGGIDGRPVELTSVDDQGDPAKNAAIVRDLVDKGVIATVGDANVGTSGGGAPVLQQAGISAVGGWANGPEWFGEYDNMFLIISGGATPEKCVPQSASMAVAEGGKKVAIVAYDIPAGKIDADCNRQGLERLGAELVPDRPLEQAPGQADLRPLVQEVIDAGADSMIVQTGVADIVNLVKAADQLGFEGNVYAGNGMHTTVLEGLGPIAEKWDGRLYGQSYGLLPDDDNPELAAFLENIPEKYKNHNFAVPGWAAGMMFKDAVDEVGTDPKAITEYLQGLDGYDANGLIPPVKYAEALDPQRCVLRVVNVGSEKFTRAPNQGDDWSCAEMFDASK